MELYVNKGDFLELNRVIKIDDEIFQPGSLVEVIEIDDTIPKLKIDKNGKGFVFYSIRSDLFRKLTELECEKIQKERNERCFINKDMCIENVNDIKNPDGQIIKAGTKFLALSGGENPVVIFESGIYGVFSRLKIVNKTDYKIIEASIEESLKKWNVKNVNFLNENYLDNAGYEIDIENAGQSIKAKSVGLITKKVTYMAEDNTLQDLNVDLRKTINTHLSNNELLDNFIEYLAFKHYSFNTFSNYVKNKLQYQDSVELRKQTLTIPVGKKFSL